METSTMLTDEQIKIDQIAHTILKTLTVRDSFDTVKRLLAKTCQIKVDVKSAKPTDDAMASVLTVGISHDHMCPSRWRLSTDELAHVRSVCYNNMDGRITVTLAPPPRTPDEPSYADRLWDTPLAPGEKQITVEQLGHIDVEGIGTLGQGQTDVSNFITHLAKAAISAAKLRDSSKVAVQVKRAKAVKYKKDAAKSLSYIIVITGIVSFGANMFMPETWEKTCFITANMMRHVFVRYMVNQGEIRIAIPTAAITDLNFDNGPVRKQSKTV